MYGNGAYCEITYCGLAGAAAPPPADDPETRFVIDDARLDDDLDAFHDFIAQLVEDAVAADDSETRITLDDTWWLEPGEQGEPEFLLLGHVEESVEFLLDTLPVHEIEADDRFDAWLDVIVEDVAAAADALETRIVLFDSDWETDPNEGFYVDPTYNEIEAAIAVVYYDYIVRARRRGVR